MIVYGLNAMKKLRIYYTLIVLLSLPRIAISASRNESEIIHEKIFLCHDYSDKEFVAEINRELKFRNISTWFDVECMQIGDSVIDAINRGLKSSQYVAIVISPEFLKNTRLANREYKGTIQLLRSKSCKRILPIWRGVRSRDVVEFDPQLADVVAERVSKPPIIDLGEVRSVVDRIVEMINPE